MDASISVPVGLKVQAAFNFLKETQPQVSLSLPLTSWVVRAWLFTYKNDFVKMERA